MLARHHHNLFNSLIWQHDIAKSIVQRTSQREEDCHAEKHTTNRTCCTCTWRILYLFRWQLVIIQESTKKRQHRYKNHLKKGHASTLPKSHGMEHNLLALWWHPGAFCWRTHTLSGAISRRITDTHSIRRTLPSQQAGASLRITLHPYNPDRTYRTTVRSVCDLYWIAKTAQIKAKYR